MAEKTALLAPMPRASVSITVNEKAGAFARLRAASRKFRSSASRYSGMSMSRVLSICAVRLPNCRWAARSASASLMPACCNSSARSVTWKASSF